MPENKALKVLPPELPKEYRDFVACTRDTLEVPPGPLTWAKIPGVPDSLKPTATFSRGEGGAVKVSISAAGLGLDVDISVTKHGNLKADTSTWPTDAPFIGDQLKDLAKGVDTWVNDLNAEFRKNKKKLGPISVKDGKLIGSKVALDARTAMAETPAPTGDPVPTDRLFRDGVPSTADVQYAADSSTQWEQTIRAPVPTVSDYGTAVPDVTTPASGRFRAPALVGIGAGLVITASSGGFLLFGQPAPTGGEGLALPPIGSSATMTGTLATTGLDMEVVEDLGSHLTLTFPANGGLVEGSGQVKFVARSSQGPTFTNTSDLHDWIAVFDPASGEIIGAAQHRATGEAPGQQPRVQDLDPMIMEAALDDLVDKWLGQLAGNGFDYPLEGSTTAVLTAATPSNRSTAGAFDTSFLDRSDTNETVLENSWRIFLNDPDTIAGVGEVRVNQVFTSDAFGAGCEFEAIRVMDVRGTFDRETGAVTARSRILAWGNKADSCTFETGVATEEAAATGTLDLSSGALDLAIAGSAQVLGPFSATATFDRSLLGTASAPAADRTVPLAGLAVGIGLTLGSLGLGILGGRRSPGSEAAG